MKTRTITIEVETANEVALEDFTTAVELLAHNIFEHVLVRSEEN